MAGILARFSRRKTHGLSENLDGHGSQGLAKVLTTFDLTLLGVGSTLGVGIYVLAGKVALSTGPAVCISFLIAAIASAIAAMCYAEFGARVPKAGSAYIYSYVTVGEFIAFIIGWNLILEYLIGTASVARAFSSNVDALFNYSMQHAFEEVAPMDIPLLSSYVDFFAAAITLLLSVLLATGMETSSKFTNVFTFVNVGVVCFVIVTGIINADPANWSIDPNTTHVPGKDLGTGGFAPFGISGIFEGAATCFFAFVGFDSIAATGEEAKNPKRSIPIAINLTLIIVFIAYFSVSVVLTLMVPYYEQDPNTPLVTAYENIEGWGWAAWTVNIGSIFGISASLLGALIPMPRIVYAMAKDGLLFRFLGVVNRRFQTPIIATAVSGVCAAIMCMIFDLDALVDMMSIGTLLAYTLVAVCVLLLRYEHTEIAADSVVEGKKRTTPETQRRATLVVILHCVMAVTFCLLLVLGVDALSNGKAWCVTLLSILGLMMVANICYLNFLPRSSFMPFFMVPLVPLLPAISVIINVYLMMKLSPYTWLRFGVWMILGFAIYFLYGIFNSTEQLIASGKLPAEVEDTCITGITGHTNEAFQHSEKKHSISDSSTHPFVPPVEVIAVDEIRLEATPVRIQASPVALAYHTKDPNPAPAETCTQVNLASIAESLEDRIEEVAVTSSFQNPIDVVADLTQDSGSKDDSHVDQVQELELAIINSEVVDKVICPDSPTLESKAALIKADYQAEVIADDDNKPGESQKATLVQIHKADDEPGSTEPNESLEPSISVEGNIVPSKGVDPAFELALFRAREMHIKLQATAENNPPVIEQDQPNGKDLDLPERPRRSSSIRKSPQLDIVMQELTSKVSEVEPTNFDQVFEEMDSITSATPPTTPNIVVPQEEEEKPSNPAAEILLSELKGAFQRINATIPPEDAVVSVSPKQVTTIMPDLTQPTTPSTDKKNTSASPKAGSNRVPGANEDYKKIFNMFNGK